MTLSKPFIERPIATTLLMVALLLAGIVAYRLLPVSALPQVDYPIIQVVATYPGASPEVMASSVTAPLERQLGQMAGLTEMTSNSSSGAMNITSQFSLSTPLDVAEQEVQEAINAALTYLPADLPNPPVYNKVNPADPPILTLALTSSTLPLPKVEDFADTRLAQKISQLPGVGLVSINGGQRPAVRIQANPVQLSAYGLTLEDLRAAIIAANVNTAKGNFDGPRQSYTINANDQLQTSAEYKPIILAYSQGSPVHLSDVANAVDSAENVLQAAWMNTTPAIILNVQRQPGANVIAVVDRIKTLLPQIQAVMPGGMHLSILTDRTLTIRSSISDTQFELFLAVALVVMIIFIFLRNLSATIIPSFSVPLSLIGAFSIMYLLGFSITILTLMALVIATGFVVDDAIVMIENITRFMEQGETPMQAALKGSGQIGFTIFSLTLSIVAVLIPLLFMQEIIGRLFREFAITLAVAVLLSGFVSLTLTPMLCSRILRPRQYPATSRTIRYYSRGLEWVLLHQRLILLLTLLVLLITLLLFYIIPKDFFPSEDTGVIQGISEAPQDISFPSMVERQQSLVKQVLKDPAVANVSSFIGVDNINPTLNSGRVNITLKPLSKRKVRAQEIINRLNNKLSKNIKDIHLYLQASQDITINNRVTRGQYQFSLNSPNINEVQLWSHRLVDYLKQLPALRDVANEQQNQGLQTYLNYDRNTAYRLGLTAQVIDNTLYDAFGQRQVSIMFTQSNQYRVVLETLPAFQESPSALDNIFINTSVNASVIPSNTSFVNGSSSFTPFSILSASTSSTLANTPGNIASLNAPVSATAPNNAVPTHPINNVSGGAVPLSAFTKRTLGIAPLLISRQGQFPVAVLSFNLANHHTLGDAVDAVNKGIEKIHLPASIETRFEGAAAAFQNSLQNEGWLLLAAIVVVYILLGILYESYIHPATILSTLPSACMGALLALWLTGGSLNVIAIIGIILLIGIVMKNAILMIDFALELERQQKKSARDAIYQAGLLRFRPILMTTLVAMLGAVPLAFGSGMGAELRRPLGVVIIAGLLVSQLLTLFSTPVIYLAFDRLSKRVSHWRSSRFNPSSREA
jgi:multidrug efflux pump